VCHLIICCGGARQRASPAANGVRLRSVLGATAGGGIRLSRYVKVSALPQSWWAPLVIGAIPGYRAVSGWLSVAERDMWPATS
jgi:hypothetical protein